MDHGFPSLAAELRDYSNVFFLAPSLGNQGEEGCMSLCTLVPPAEASVLVITTTQTPDDRLDAWRMYADELPEEMAFVDVGGTTRSASTGDASTAADGSGDEFPVETVSNPGNLTRIGVTASNVLSEWSGTDRRPVICFRSLTTLLQYSDVQEVFRFLHELTRLTKGADAHAHYHMDPTAHDEQEQNRLKTLFDAVVEPDGEGGWNVVTR